MDSGKGVTATPAKQAFANRAERREAQKAARGRSKPVSKHSRKIMLNTAAYVAESVRAVRQDERERLCKPLFHAMDELRMGKASYRRWQLVARWTNMLYVVNQKGVVRQMDEYLELIRVALTSIFHCACGDGASIVHVPEYWNTPTLYASEIDALHLLKTLVNLVFEEHTVQEYEKLFAACSRTLQSGGCPKVPFPLHINKPTAG